MEAYCTSHKSGQYSKLFCCICPLVGEEIELKTYIELTTVHGTAHATSTYIGGSGTYEAAKAFKIDGAEDTDYWATKNTPDLPVFLWFQFNDPKNVFKVTFLEKYVLPLGSIYEVTVALALFGQHFRVPKICILKMFIVVIRQWPQRGR